MNDQRKKIIVNEILYWKANKVLPEHYCDYLIALYNQGEEAPDVKRKNKKTSSVLGEKASIYLKPASLLILLSIASFVVLYFTELSITLQTAILSFFVILFIVFGLKTDKKQLIAPLFYSAAAFLLLLQTIHLWEYYSPGDIQVLYLLIGSQCLAWFVLGIIFRMHYFTVSGFLGTIILLVTWFL
ncbi:hypothetical protein [Jeotgalibacillus soli]|uniref:DUF2157 domain-containing protein n=1 Tax=Jeotgalibacillus soli TaxID=889306 RepID=A0A0C2VKB6_9BACL|nr:hypothetical protein [Jeotgalibacillus soli]KIL44433.1 hypothetical protein KP78_33970 [Jeotgalibacillus soli]